MKKDLIVALARHTGWLAMAAPMAMLLVVSVAKLSDMPGFILSLRTWTLIPPSLILPVSFIAVSSEFIVAGWWFVGKDRRRAAIAGAVLLLCFAGTYLLHLAYGVRPSCACMGALQAAFEARDEGWMIAGRSVALAACLLAGAGLWHAGSRTGAAPHGARR